MPFLVPIIAGVAAAVSIGEAVKGTPKPPPVPSASTAAATMATQSNAAADALRARNIQAGRAATILTSPQGVTGTQSVTTQQKTLLGQ